MKYPRGLPSILKLEARASARQSPVIGPNDPDSSCAIHTVRGLKCMGDMKGPLSYNILQSTRLGEG